MNSYGSSLLPFAMAQGTRKGVCSAACKLPKGVMAIPTDTMPARKRTLFFPVVVSLGLKVRFVGSIRVNVKKGGPGTRTYRQTAMHSRSYSGR